MSGSKRPERNDDTYRITCRKTSCTIRVYGLATSLSSLVSAVVSDIGKMIAVSINNLVRCLVTQSHNLSIYGVRQLSFIFPRLIGNKANNAGKRVKENRQASITPIAVRLPKSTNAGTSEKFNVKNPKEVVSEVMNTGLVLSLIAVLSASFLRSPFR